MGFNWQVDSSISISGEAYYALTAHAIMAGGSLKASYHSGNLKAWFYIGADFLISWKPYHYDAEIRAGVGVSYTFSISIFGAHIRKTISVSLSADLHIWGPKFTGHAHVHLWIVSFSFDFGAGASQTPLPVDWGTFQSTFLPASTQTMSSSVNAGLKRKLKQGNDEIWIIDPNDFTIVTNSVVPAKTAMLGSQAQTLNQAVRNGQEVDVNTTFGIGPMGMDHGHLETSIHTITITRDGASAEAEFTVAPIVKDMPRGMWGEAVSPELNGDKFIDNAVAGFTITHAGHKLPDQTHDIPKANLNYEVERSNHDLSWATQAESMGSRATAPSDVAGIKAAMQSKASAQTELLESLGIAQPGAAAGNWYDALVV